MNNLSKAFVVANLVLAAMFAGFTISLYAKRVDWAAKYEAEHKRVVTLSTELNAKVEELEAQVKKEQELKRAADERRKIVEQNLSMLQAEYEEQGADLEREKSSRSFLEQKDMEKDRELTRRGDKIDEMHDLLLQQQQAVVVAQKNEKIARSQRVEMENQLNATRQRLAESTRSGRKLEKELAEQNYILQRLRDYGVNIDQLVAGGTFPPRPIPAKVLAVESDIDLVMLSVGSDDEVKSGYKFTISRGPEYIGQVQVSHVYKDMCAARILRNMMKPDSQIEVNDDANASVY